MKEGIYSLGKCTCVFSVSSEQTERNEAALPSPVLIRHRRSSVKPSASCQKHQPRPEPRDVISTRRLERKLPPHVPLDEREREKDRKEAGRFNEIAAWHSCRRAKYRFLFSCCLFCSGRKNEAHRTATVHDESVAMSHLNSTSVLYHLVVWE